MKETLVKLNANISANLHRRIKAAVAYEGRSMTNLLKDLLEFWIEDFEDKKAVTESRRLYKEHPEEFVDFENYAQKRRENV